MVYKSLNMSILGCGIKYFIPHAKINKKSVTFAQNIKKMNYSFKIKLFNLKN